MGKNVHELSAIGRAQAAVEEQAALCEKIEERIEGLDAQLEGLKDQLANISFDVEVEDVAALLDRKNATWWLRKRLAGTRLRREHEELDQTKSRVSHLQRQLAEAREELETLDSPTLGWSQELRDLRRGYLELRLQWLVGDPAEDAAMVEQARAAKEGYNGPRGAVVRGTLADMRTVMEKIQRRGR